MARSSSVPALMYGSPSIWMSYKQGYVCVGVRKHSMLGMTHGPGHNATGTPNDDCVKLAGPRGVRLCCTYIPCKAPCLAC